MNTFRALSADKAVNTVRTWAELNWPFSRDQSYALRDHLGWEPEPEHKDLFTTLFGLGDDTGWFTFVDHFLASVSFKLTSIAPKGATEDVAAKYFEMFSLYEASLSTIWGPSTRSRHREIDAAEWTLPNGASVTLTGADRGVFVSIESPYLTEVARIEAIEEADDRP